MNSEFISAIRDLEKEKGIKKEYVIESIETALVTAYKRNFDALENVRVDIDKTTGATHLYSIKEIVENLEKNMLFNNLPQICAGKVKSKLLIAASMAIHHFFA